MGEGFGLLRPGDGEIVEGTNALFAGGERRAERLDLVRGLDGAGMLEDRLPVDDAGSERVERPDHRGVGPVDGEGVRGAPVFAERLADLPRPARRHRFRVVRDRPVVEGDRWADFAHALEPGAQVPPGREVEEYRRAVRERERVADDIVHRPDLHVPRAGRVAEVDGVHHQHRLVLLAVKLLADALRAVRANRPLVDGVDGFNGRQVVHQLMLHQARRLGRDRPSPRRETAILLRLVPKHPPVVYIERTKHPPVSSANCTKHPPLS